MMNERMHWVTLSLSCVLAAFALGVLFARGASAQILVPTPPYPFPKVSELWSLQLDQASWVPVNIEGGGGTQIGGFQFTIAKDQAGRLPVVTAFLAHEQPYDNTPNSSYELWQQAADGGYRRIFAQSSSYPVFTNNQWTTNSSSPMPDRSFGQGMVLSPGSYVFRLPQDQQGGASMHDTALLGYLARP